MPNSPSSLPDTLPDSLPETLQKALHDTLSTGQQAAELAAQALWNGDRRRTPLAVAQCRNVADVQTAVRLATGHGVPLSVLGGGHDWASRAVRPQALVLDLRRLNHVSAPATDRTVTVGGGALTWDLLQALPADLVAPTGTVSTVGVAGLTLGGGYGRLISKFGLASDAMIGAEVVLADGSLVHANDRENSDLFWALRGGGGNFGVVTALTFQAYTVPSVLSVNIAVPLSAARATLLHLQDVLDQAPEELSLFSALLTLPTGEPGLILQPLVVGESAGAEQLLDQLCSLDGAQVLSRSRSSYRDTFNLEAEKAWPKGLCYRLSARNIARLERETIDVLLQSAQAFPAPACAFVLHDFHGKASRIAPDSTAFSLRQKHFNVEIIGAWDGRVDGLRDAVDSWADQATENLTRVALPGGYVNLLGPDEMERTRAFFGPALPRLEQIKQRFDPGNAFSSNVGALHPAPEPVLS